MKQFHPLKIADLKSETSDSVRVVFELPAALQSEYTFLPGQHLPLQVDVDGKKLRRTYSICSAIGAPLEIGVRVQPGGRFSERALGALHIGDYVEAMPPTGQFFIRPDPGNAKDYVGFAAGSGITPILSMIKSILVAESNSRFMLFYGNRKQSTTMFIDDLYALKNLYMERLQLNFVFSREEQEFEPMAGRLDGDKVHELYRHFGAGVRAAECFVCGPDSMIQDVSDALKALGMDAAHIHSERFGVPRKTETSRDAEPARTTHQAEITVIMDGHKKTFSMQRKHNNIVDAAAESGIELPYSCKGGVCATCRCFVRAGEVRMQANYGLEAWELAEGFVLACQSRPVSASVVLDYDHI